MNEILDILAQTTQVVTSQAIQTWQSELVSAHSKLLAGLVAGSLGIFAVTFTAASTLTRIKDKLYDSSEYRERVGRAQALDRSLLSDLDTGTVSDAHRSLTRDYRPYQQLSLVFQGVRWFALVNAVLNIGLAFGANWWLAAIAFAAFALEIILLAWFTHLCHVNLAEITRIDQQRIDEERRKQQRQRDQTQKPYMNLHRA